MYKCYWKIIWSVYPHIHILYKRSSCIPSPKLSKLNLDSIYLNPEQNKTGFVFLTEGYGLTMAGTQRKKKQDESTKESHCQLYVLGSYPKSLVKTSLILGWGGPHPFGSGQSNILVVVALNQEEASTTEEILQLGQVVFCHWSKTNTLLSARLRKAPTNLTDKNE